MANPSPESALAVLTSGGLDSAILVGDSLRRGQAVVPLYVRCGLYWEPVEQIYLQNYLAALACPLLRPLQVLQMPVADLYGDHWSITGTDVPNAASVDEAVYLPGRNVLLLSKALLWCHLHGVRDLALGSLQSNPFPDASPEFFQGFALMVNRGVQGRVRLHCPFAGWSKREVMQRGRSLPLEWTFSCIHPVAERHCGSCNKCAERRRAFRDAGLVDPTLYAE